MTEELLKQQHQVITECWKLLRIYQNPVDTVEFWERVMADARRIYELYPTEFCNEVTVVVIRELERQAHVVCGKHATRTR